MCMHGYVRVCVRAFSLTCVSITWICVLARAYRERERERERERKKDRKKERQRESEREAQVSVHTHQEETQTAYPHNDDVACIVMM